MEDKHKLREQFDFYILGKLKGEEQTAFLKAVQQYPDLIEELKNQKDLAHGIDTFVNRDIKGRLQNIQKEFNAEQNISESKPVRSLYRMLAAAASILLLLGIAYWAFQAPKQSTGDLYAAYYEPYQDLFSVRNDAVDQQLIAANDAYLKHNYAEALVIFEKLLAANPTDSKLLLATGICQLETGDTETARTHFQSIVQLNDVYLSDQALWYSALAHLKENNSTIAKTVLQQLLQKDNADHFQEAQKLLKALD